MHPLHNRSFPAMFAIFSAIVIQAVLTTAASAQTAAAATPAIAETAAASLGDWTISGSGANGSVTFALAIKADAGKVVGDISGEVMARQTITDISKSPTSLLLSRPSSVLSALSVLLVL